MTDTAPSPPDVSVWWDEAATAAAAMAQLRLVSGDVDEDRVTACVGAAGAKINQLLDRDQLDAWTTGTAPPDALADLIQVTVAEYRAKDAPAASLDGILLPPPLDTLAGTRPSLSKHRKRWGVG